MWEQKRLALRPPQSFSRGCRKHMGDKLLKQPLAQAQTANFLEPASCHTPSQHADGALCCPSQELQARNLAHLMSWMETAHLQSLSLAPHSPTRVAQGDLGHGSRHRFQPALGLRSCWQAPAHSALAAERGAPDLPGRRPGAYSHPLSSLLTWFSSSPTPTPPSRPAPLAAPLGQLQCHREVLGASFHPRATWPQAVQLDRHLTGGSRHNSDTKILCGPEGSLHPFVFSVPMSREAWEIPES